MRYNYHGQHREKPRAVTTRWRDESWQIVTRNRWNATSYWFTSGYYSNTAENDRPLSTMALAQLGKMLSLQFIKRLRFRITQKADLCRDWCVLSKITCLLIYEATFHRLRVSTGNLDPLHLLYWCRSHTSDLCLQHMKMTMRKTFRLQSYLLRTNSAMIGSDWPSFWTRTNIEWPLACSKVYVCDTKRYNEGRNKTIGYVYQSRITLYAHKVSKYLFDAK